MSMDSSVAGYLGPEPSTALPGSLSLEDFLQTVFVGISGFDGTLVRPKWQIEAPKQPIQTTDWMAIGIQDFEPDANAYVNTDVSGVTTLLRHQQLEVSCSVYGPNTYENTSALIDGFQITQNLEALQSANMGFVGVSKPMRVPELVNGLWCDRYELTFTFRKENTRVYPILSLVSASGQIKSVVSGQAVALPWNAQT